MLGGLVVLGAVCWLVMVRRKLYQTQSVLEHHKRVFTAAEAKAPPVPSKGPSANVYELKEWSV